VLARAIPDAAADWLSFPVDDHAVRSLATRLCGWLQADSALRAQTRGPRARRARALVVEGVAKGVIAAARGELDELAQP